MIGGRGGKKRKLPQGGTKAATAASIPTGLGVGGLAPVGGAGAGGTGGSTSAKYLMDPGAFIIGVGMIGCVVGGVGVDGRLVSRPTAHTGGPTALTPPRGGYH